MLRFVDPTPFAPDMSWLMHSDSFTMAEVRVHVIGSRQGLAQDMNQCKGLGNSIWWPFPAKFHPHF